MYFRVKYASTYPDYPAAIFKDLRLHFQTELIQFSAGGSRKNVPGKNVSRKDTPRKSVPRKIAPWKFAHHEKYPHENCPLEK